MRWTVGVLLGLAVGAAPAQPASLQQDCEGTASIEEGRAGATPTVEATGLPDLNTIHADVTDWKFDAEFELPEIPEPSGLCYCALTNTIFVVDDGAADRQSGLYEIDLDGNYKRGIKLGADLEGVCFCAANGSLYVADEKDQWVYRVDAKDLHLIDKLRISIKQSYVSGDTFGSIDILKPGGNGFEGIEWLDPTEWCSKPPKGGFPEAGYLLLLNQDDPTAILIVPITNEVRSRVIEPWKFFLLPQRNSGELRLNPESRELWVVNSWLNTTEILDLTRQLDDTSIESIDQGGRPLMSDWGKELRVERWEVMPGMAQEGVTFDPQGRMWIGQDVGGVVRYTKGS
jgi:hypothetical protein